MHRFDSTRVRAVLGVNGVNELVTYEEGGPSLLELLCDVLKFVSVIPSEARTRLHRLIGQRAAHALLSVTMHSGALVSETDPKGACDEQRSSYDSRTEFRAIRSTPEA
jgi:hypothetical protein